MDKDFKDNSTKDSCRIQNDDENVDGVDQVQNAPKTSQSNTSLWV